MRGLVCSLGRVRGGFSLGGVRAMGFWPSMTSLTMFMIFSPAAGPVAPLKVVSRVSRSRLIFGKHPVMMIFLFFGVCFMSFMMRFSVGPLTAQVL